jgi:hypothetical protein
MVRNVKQSPESFTCQEHHGMLNVSVDLLHFVRIMWLIMTLKVIAVKCQNPPAEASNTTESKNNGDFSAGRISGILHRKKPKQVA